MYWLTRQGARWWKLWNKRYITSLSPMLLFASFRFDFCCLRTMVLLPFRSVPECCRLVRDWLHYSADVWLKCRTSATDLRTFTYTLYFVSLWIEWFKTLLSRIDGKQVCIGRTLSNLWMNSIHWMEFFSCFAMTTIGDSYRQVRLYLICHFLLLLNQDAVCWFITSYSTLEHL